MKYQLFTILTCITLVSGCREREKIQVISISVFEPKDRTKQASIADLASLKAYADSSYNPDLRPQILDPSDLDRIGYSLRMSANSELKSGSQRVFSQGIPWSDGSMAIIAETRFAENGGYNLSMNIRAGTEEPQESNKRTAYVGIPSTGTVVLANGLIATWSTEPKK